MAARIVTIYIDYKSPYAYLAKDPAWNLEREFDLRLEWLHYTLQIPEFLGTVEGRNAHQWRRVRYSYMDARRLANRRSLTVRGPQKLFDSRLALMSGLFADHHGKFPDYARKVWELFFRRELDIEKFDELAPLLQSFGLDADAFRRYAEIDGPRELAEAVTEGERDEIFGVPTLMVDGEPFWGNDRIEWVIKKLDAMGLRRN